MTQPKPQTASQGLAVSTNDLPAAGPANDDCGHRIQISVAVPQSAVQSSPWVAVVDRMLSAQFVWSLMCAAALVAWRRDLRRLLYALINRIESGAKIDIVGVKMEAPPDDSRPYTVILDEEGRSNGIDME